MTQSDMMHNWSVIWKIFSTPSWPKIRSKPVCTTLHAHFMLSSDTSVCTSRNGYHIWACSETKISSSFLGHSNWTIWCPRNLFLAYIFVILSASGSQQAACLKFLHMQRNRHRHFWKSMTIKILFRHSKINADIERDRTSFIVRPIRWRWSSLLYQKAVGPLPEGEGRHK